MIRIKGIESTISSVKQKVAQKLEAERRAKMEKLVSDLKAATPVDTGEARDGWKIEGNSVVNRVDHIGVLNSGSSKQAPLHFVERTVLAQEGLIPNGVIVKTT
jgi:hypothetical protein